MPSNRKKNKDDRLFVRDGRRTYRKNYSLAEVRYGAGILLVLALVFSWVTWKGAHPDPELFAANIELLNPGSAPADRGPLPADLAPDGWTEGAVSQYDTTNLYVKINGREDYYRAFGFERLYFLSLTSDDDAALAVDVELFDLGTAANALGAYAGERPPDVIPDLTESGMAHTARNALFLTRGQYYIRAIGSDETPGIINLLAKLRPRFEDEMEGEQLPWGYALFTGALGIDPGDIDYMTESAFSFGFAYDVYAATLEDGESQLFVTPAEDETAAREQADQFTEGFLGYGREAERSDGVIWVRDRYINTLATGTSAGPWVIGVRGATDMGIAREGLARLREAIATLSIETHALAYAAKEAAAPIEDYEESGESFGNAESYGEAEGSFGEGESDADAGTEGEGGVREY